MAWKLQTLNAAVDKEIDALPDKLLAKLLHIGDMLTELGPQRVTMPHVRHLEGKLWEMRMQVGKGAAGRAIYIARKGQRLVILHAFVKKSQKTPKHHLETARKRAQDLGDD